MRVRLAVSALLITAVTPQSARVSAQTPGAMPRSASDQSGMVTGTWQVTTGVTYPPWTIDLKQSGANVTGTVRQKGGLTGPSDIYEGTIQGNTVSFKANSPSGGRVITFTGLIAGDSIAFTRSVLDTVHQTSGAGVFGAAGAMQFAVRRADAAAAAAALAPPAPAAPAASAAAAAAMSTAARQGSLHWVADSVSAGGPWVFDVDTAHGQLTGSADQASGVTGAFQMENGRVVGDSIFFMIHYFQSGIDRDIDFAGLRQGDVIRFSRTVRAISGSTVGNALVGGGGSNSFIARAARPGEALPGPRPVRTLSASPSAAAAGAPVVVKRIHYIGANGPWRIDSVPGGPWTFDFTATAAALTGTVKQSKEPSTPMSVAAGTIDGATITFKALSPDAQRLVTFTGHLSGDTISFTRAVAALPGGTRGTDGLFGGSAASKFVATRDNPYQLNYKGFTVDIAAIASDLDRDAILDGVRGQLDIIDGVKLTAAQRQFFRSVPLVMYSATGSATYGGGQVRVPSHSTPAYDKDHPILLHEMLHGYHDLKIPDGFHNAEIERLYEQAKASGNFPADSYMLSTPAEYFAMMSSTYLYGTIARDPFTRDAVKTKQPDMYQWLLKEFGPQ